MLVCFRRAHVVGQGAERADGVGTVGGYDEISVVNGDCEGAARGQLVDAAEGIELGRVDGFAVNLVAADPGAVREGDRVAHGDCQADLLHELLGTDAGGVRRHGDDLLGLGQPDHDGIVRHVASPARRR